MPCRACLCAVAAYGIWGTLPLYLRALDAVPPLEILCHRILWTVLLLAPMLLSRRRRAALHATVTDPAAIGLLAASALLLATNWLLYIHAVAERRVLEPSLGYFINPLVNVVLGVALLGERLGRLQVLAVLIAAAGVLLEAVSAHRVPWIALALAGSFGMYGLLRKRMAADPATGLLVETAILALPAAAVLLLSSSPTADLGSNPASLNALLVAAGPITAVPLLLFVAAARRLRYATLGMLQYLAPTLMFLIAALWLDERPDPARGRTFVAVWTALLLYSVAMLRHARRQP